MRFARLEAKAAAMDLSRELAYKGNFLMKGVAFVITDFIGPILTLLIYSTTLGIPGWTIYEFLLLQGSLIIFSGLGHLFVLALPYDVIRAIDKGEFDKYLIKPYPPLLYLITQSVLVEGLIEMFAGVFIVAVAMWNLSITVFSVNFLLYVGIVLFGLLFQAGVMILISSLSFLFVKSDALMHLYYKLSDFARWPLTVYSPLLKLLLIFLVPVAISSFFPAKVLLDGFSASLLWQAFLPVLAFLAVAVWCWNMAMRRYASAGG